MTLLDERFEHLVKARYLAQEPLLRCPGACAETGTGVDSVSGSGNVVSRLLGQTAVAALRIADVVRVV